MGLGAYPASGPNWLKMAGLHGSYEANMAMHDCDVMICIGARFDDRVTARVDRFSPHSRKIHIDVDTSSFNKNVPVDIAIQGDAGKVLADLVRQWRARAEWTDKTRLVEWWEKIASWRVRNSLSYAMSDDVIMPQYAIARLYELTKDRDTFITTEVGQHQMWAAQHYGIEEPNRWMTSGGSGTMGYGLPAALGVQIAHPNSLVIDIAGDASVQMTMKEMSAAVQHNAPIKIFILNNAYMGMVRQLQHVSDVYRRSRTYSETVPDFMKLADAYGVHGIRCEKPDELDEAIMEMIDAKGPVIFDCRVAQLENCLPMIRPGGAHNDMLLPDDVDKGASGYNPSDHAFL
jgi:acetolactate synthase-1/2/3 large subunit